MPNTVGFIGLGAMGGPMALNLVKQGFLLVVHDIDPVKAERLRVAGAAVADSAEAVAAAVGRTICMVETTAQTEEVVLGDKGVIEGAARGHVEIDVGEWTGLSLAQARRRKEWEIVQSHPSGFRFPGGESFMEAQTRMTAAVARLVERHRGGTIVAVSHADPIKLFAAHALGTPLDLFQRIVIATGSITVIAWPRDVPGVLTVNSVDGQLTAYGLA